MVVVSRPSVRIGVIDLGIWMYAKGVAQNAPGGSSATGNGDDETAVCLPSAAQGVDHESGIDYVADLGRQCPRGPLCIGLLPRIV